jgi:hypothetical protein
MLADLGHPIEANKEETPKIGEAARRRAVDKIKKITKALREVSARSHSARDLVDSWPSVILEPAATTPSCPKGDNKLTESGS